MTTEFNTPFDIYRANLEFSVHVLTLGLEWQQNVYAFEARRLERDLRAISHTLDAIAVTKDWNTVAAMSQALLHDYVTRGASALQERVGTTIQNQCALRDNISNALKHWQLNVTGPMLGAGDKEVAGTPFRGWVNAFERAMTGVMDNYTAVNSAETRATQSGQVVAQRARTSRGEHHVS
ncbi:hypothetical protein [Paraburkholderia hospita]|uniref:hypothetical protein n=1 Tax=Paraburkholderia hospita TaxID=169430 RepID=UPI000B343101|nr:hypothetical protein [Paraburkholderia hospita]OUL96376.1 hypothetical protein CA601_02755 [Paraburkholderia hospita]